MSRAPLVISPSSKKQWEECNRRWGRERIEGHKSPQGEKAALGTRGHEITERYLKHGTAPNQHESVTLMDSRGRSKTYYPGRFASNIFQHLPPAGSFAEDEGERAFSYTVGGHAVRGIKDGRKYFPGATGDVQGKRRLRIYDHKFTSSLQYAQTAKTLTEDTQALIYLDHEWDTTDETEIDAQWTYGQFDAKSSRPVNVTFVRDREPVKRMLPVFDAMAKAYDTISDARDLPKNLSSCNLYGKPCHHAEWCGINHTDRVSQIMAGFKKTAQRKSFMSPILAKLQIKQFKAGNGPQPSAEAYASAGEPYPGAPAAAAPAPVSAPAAAVVTPPPAVAPVVVPAAPEATTAQDTPPQPINPPGEAAAVAAHVAAQAAAVAGQAPAADVPKPRGRPRKTGVAIVETGAAAAPTALAPVAAAIVPANTDADGAERITRIKRLYVNCMPLSGERPVSAHELIAEALDAVCKELPEVSHYSFVDFGKGRGVLAICVLGALDARPDCDVYLDTTSPEGRDCMEALASRANFVIRGI